ncbi:MAG: thiosulfate oxidation carrier complex protein SoxZ [Burkholderiales bacterium]|nr:thiosulfate oxidation carrier complex protein SoxZ [Burkholderiales bacterium]OUT79284.1 MAG: thiosulfate oxidation carrier complex protein SoxZ [Betaproteobacteria bacterium TMED22]|tara:strand:- start:389 stop:709 length:321 start_codon:yes stop_codon:yes gene_type:complete
MARPMKIFAVCDESGLTTVRVLIRHNMETGFRKNKDGTLVPAHFITNVEVRHGKNKVLTAEWGGGVSKNPSLFCYFRGGVPGESVEVSWIDNHGESDQKSAIISSG